MNARLRRQWLAFYLLMGLGLACGGCQTFGLTEQQFEAQQRGCTVDPETGMLVGVAGYAGLLGAAIAELAHK